MLTEWKSRYEEIGRGGTGNLRVDLKGLTLEVLKRPSALEIIGGLLCALLAYTG